MPKVFVKINGKTSEIPDNISIQGLVSARKITDSIIMELNGTSVSRELWESISLNPG
jgi:sulfur carrier protein ThiS